MTLYFQLKPCWLECPLMGQPFLHLDILDKKLTKQESLNYSLSRFNHEVIIAEEGKAPFSC
jgi:hypothetical protein